MCEQLFEQYEEMKKEYDENTDQEATITDLLYIDGFRYDDVDKVIKINKMVQQRIDKRVKLVQDFGVFRKNIVPQEQTHQLLKDIDMHINSIMFELDKLEQLRSRTSRFLRMQSQPGPVTDQMASTQNKFNFGSTSDGTSKMCMSSYQFYKSQRDQQIQDHSQKWTLKQYQIQQKQLNDEIKFQKFKEEVEDKQVKAEQNLQEYQKWQRNQLAQQEQLNNQRMLTHKERVQRDTALKLQRIESKIKSKEENLIHNKELLNDYQVHCTKQKREQYERIKQKSMQADMAKTSHNLKQKQLVEEKEIENLKKMKYIEEMREWNQNYLRQQAAKNDEKTAKANLIVASQGEFKRQKQEEKQLKEAQYKAKYDNLHQDYMVQTIKAKEQKMSKYLIQKAFQDASQAEFTRYQFSMRAQSEQQGLRLKEKRMRVVQEEMAAASLLRQLEINQRQQILADEFEQKREEQLQHELALLQRAKMVEDERKQLEREREIIARKLEMEKESTGKLLKTGKINKQQ